MIGQQQISIEVTGFVTHRLLDLAQAYQVDCEESLRQTDIPSDTVKAISWLKYDRIATVASKYVHLSKLDESVAIDVQLLSDCIAEVSHLTPFTETEHTESCCVVSSKRKAYQTNVHSVLSAVFVALMAELRQGEKQVSKSFDIPTEVVWALSSLHTAQCLQVARHYSERVCYTDFFRLDLNLLQSMVNATYETVELERKLDQFILLGANKRMIMDLFGARSVQIALRRKALEFGEQKKLIWRKRRSELDEFKRQDVFNKWVSLLDMENEIDRYLAVAEQTNVRLGVIYTIIEDMANEPFCQKQIEKRTQCA